MRGRCTLLCVAGRDVVHGAGAKAAQVQPAGGGVGSERGEGLRSRMASLSASPVTSPRDSNPIDSAGSLAAAAGSDAGALDLLDRPPAAGGDGQPQGEESASDAVKRREAAAKSRLDMLLLCQYSSVQTVCLASATYSCVKHRVFSAFEVLLLTKSLGCIGG